ncbi:MAG: WGR domain-containing protein [Marinibacterium sp.]|nr:WGR domain-containing protein [Marinibacterium sp.]
MKTELHPTPVQIEVFPDQVYLERTDAAQNMNRYYLMKVQRDLFGGAQLIREWGRIGSPGRVLTTSHADEGLAVDALAEITQKKKKRGYCLVA